MNLDCLEFPAGDKPGWQDACPDGTGEGLFDYEDDAEQDCDAEQDWEDAL